MAGRFFRASAGLRVVDGAGRLLALRRKGVDKGGRQMPQGGIDHDEAPCAAALRELAEETALRAGDGEALDEFPDWPAYELPSEFRRPQLGLGQAQKWFLLRARDGVTVRPDDDEFGAYQRVAPGELLTRVIAFGRPVYEQVLARFGKPD